MHLILASQSEGRKKLLSQYRIPFEIIPSYLDEDKIVAKTPLSTVKLRAKLKGEDVAGKITVGSNLILSADSGAILGKTLIGKPKDYNEAVKILKTLSGKTHEFVTAIYIIKAGGERGRAPEATDVRSTDGRESLDRTRAKYKYRSNVWQDFDTSFVTFRKLTGDDIRRYLSITNYTKYAGGYALFDSPQDFITEIRGSLSNVIGLPLEKFNPVLRLHNLLSV